MASNRRLQKELAGLKTASSFSDVLKLTEVDESNMLNWVVCLKPEREPYNKASFRVSIEFPSEYPFKPPKLTFLSKIYHPNIDEQGNVCLGLLRSENWKPATRIDQVLSAVLQLIVEPQLETPLRAELAEEYQKDRKKFFRNAEEFMKKFGDKR